MFLPGDRAGASGQVPSPHPHPHVGETRAENEASARGDAGQAAGESQRQENNACIPAAHCVLGGGAAPPWLLWQ